MLLDALCNMFGGIIFVALLVAIMSGERGNGDDGSITNDGPVRIAKDHQLAIINNQIRELAAKDPASWDAVEQSFVYQQATSATSSRVVSVTERMNARTPPVEIAIVEARREIERLEQLKQALANARDNPDTEPLEDAIAHESSEVAGLELQLQATAQRRIIHARLALERKTDKWRVFLYLKGNKAWLAVADTNKNFSIDPSECDQRDVTYRETTDLLGNPDGFVFTPRPTGGFVVTDRVRHHPRFTELVQMYPQYRYFIVMTVDSDAHATFSLLKEAFLECGYKYNFSFSNGLTSMTFVYGNVAPTTQ